MDYEIPDWFTNLVSMINSCLSDEDKAHSIVLDNKAISKLTDKDYDYIWHQTSILRLERLLKLQQQQLGKCITTKVPQYLIETINALEVCIDYHRHPTVSKQRIAKELVNTVYLTAYSAIWAANSAASSASWAAYSALAANSAAYSAVDSAYSAAYAVKVSTSWKQEAIGLSKVLNDITNSRSNNHE